MKLCVQRFNFILYVVAQELLEKKILKTGPYKPNDRENELSSPQVKEIKRDWNNEGRLYKAPPYILGYTGNRKNNKCIILQIL